MILNFPEQPRRQKKLTKRAAAQVHVLPLAHHRKAAAFIAAEMRKLPTSDAAEEYLIEFLYIEAGRLSDFGVSDPEVERACYDFACAVWSIVVRGYDHEGVA